MSYSKIVIISTHELDRRITTLFQINELARRNIKMEYWNISEFTYKEHVTPSESTIRIVTLNREKDFIQLIKKNIEKKVLYIVYTNYAYKTLRCYMTLSKYQATMLYCINGVLPPILTSQKIMTMNSIKNGIKNRFAKIILKTALIKPVRYELQTCAKAGHAHKIDNQTRTIKFNSTDYEDSLHSGKPPVEGKYIVFLVEIFLNLIVY